MIRWKKRLLVVAALLWAAYASYFGFYLLTSLSGLAILDNPWAFVNLAAVAFGPLVLAIGVARLNWTHARTRLKNSN